MSESWMNFDTAMFHSIRTCVDVSTAFHHRPMANQRIDKCHPHRLIVGYPASPNPKSCDWLGGQQDTFWLGNVVLGGCLLSKGSSQTYPRMFLGIRSLWNKLRIDVTLMLRRLVENCCSPLLVLWSYEGQLPKDMTTKEKYVFPRMSNFRRFLKVWDCESLPETLVIATTHHSIDDMARP